MPATVLDWLFQSSVLPPAQCANSPLLPFLLAMPEHDVRVSQSGNSMIPDYSVDVGRICSRRSRSSSSARGEC